jgi:hypothetical protein
VRANLDKPRKKKRRRADESAANETPLGVKTPLWVEKNHTRIFLWTDWLAADSPAQEFADDQRIRRTGTSCGLRLELSIDSSCSI